AVSRRERDRRQVFEPKPSGEAGEFARDRLESIPGKIDQVDLVHGQNGMANTEQTHDYGVAAGLRSGALTGVDQQPNHFAVGRASCHVARVLLVSWGVSDDKGTTQRREIPIRDIDRDALLALSIEPIKQQRKINVGARGAVLPVPRQCGEMIVKDEILLV